MRARSGGPSFLPIYLDGWRVHRRPPQNSVRQSAVALHSAAGHDRRLVSKRPAALGQGCTGNCYCCLVPIDLSQNRRAPADRKHHVIMSRRTDKGLYVAYPLSTRTVILAAGSWSGLFAETLSLQIPVSPAKGELLLVAPQQGRRPQQIIYSRQAVSCPGGPIKGLYAGYPPATRPMGLTSATSIRPDSPEAIRFIGGSFRVSCPRAGRVCQSLGAFARSRPHRSCLSVQVRLPATPQAPASGSW